MTSGTWRATEGYVRCLNVDGARLLEEMSSVFAFALCLSKLAIPVRLADHIR